MSPQLIIAGSVLLGLAAPVVRWLVRKKRS